MTSQGEIRLHSGAILRKRNRDSMMQRRLKTLSCEVVHPPRRQHWLSGVNVVNCARLLCVSFALMSCCGCEVKPKIDVSPRVAGGRIIFDVSATGINSVLDFRVHDTSGGLIWAISLHGQRFKSIEY